MKTIHNMFEHLKWANQSILEALQNADVGEQELRLLSHILNAEQVWLTRLKGMDSSQMPIWSDSDIPICAKRIKQNEEDFKTYLDEIATTDLDNLITYTNSSGKAFKNSIREILTHVALHGHYHRGQINSRLRASGNEPVNIDYITFTR